MINILLLMAGEGRRFKEKGYIKDKPFISLNNSPMVSHVIENILLINESQQFIFICRESHALELTNLIPDGSRIIAVNKTTQGAACTALLAEELTNNEDELIIANCDQLIQDKDFMDNFYQFIQKHKPDGAIVSFLNDHPKWSYAKVINGQVIQVAEKNPISQIATCGIYYFKRGKDFVKCAKKMIEKNDRVNGEFYLCPVYNYMIADNKRILPYMVNDFCGLGTPEDLEKYNEHKL